MARLGSRLQPVLLALASTIGCSSPEDCEVWERPSKLDAGGTTAELLGIDRHAVAGSGATLVIEGQIQTIPSGVEADLLDIIQLDPFSGGREYLAVGTGGAVLHGRSDDYDGPWTWNIVDVGTTADLHAIGSFDLVDNLGEPHLALVGDNVLIERTPTYGDNLEVLYEWNPRDPPAGGWGSLRGASTDAIYDSAIVVGDGGRVFQRDGQYIEPQWAAVDVGTSEDLLAYCNRSGSPRVVGRNGTMIARASNYQWQRVDIGVDEDLIACDIDFVLTASGRILAVELDPPDGPVVTEVTTVAGLRAIDSDPSYMSIQPCVRAVGVAGVAVEVCPCARA